MFEKLKAKTAAKRIQRTKDFNNINKRIKNNKSETKQMLLLPLVLVARAIRWIWDNLLCVLSWLWECICEINLTGLLNLTLLVAIVVLLSMFVTNITNCNKKNVVLVRNAKSVPVEYTKKTTLPLNQNLQQVNKKTLADCETKNTSNEKAKQIKPYIINGDTIIETAQEKQMLRHGAIINGNLYLQNMRKYVLPCNVKVNGNMFLRNVNMLQFCGKFDVSGNIYVNPTSSFGPLPSDAILGGQVVL